MQDYSLHKDIANLSVIGSYMDSLDQKKRKSDGLRVECVSTHISSFVCSQERNVKIKNQYPKNWV